MGSLSNVKHEEFAQNCASGMSAAQAYLKTHPKSSTTSAETNGPALARSNQVSIRIAELRKATGDTVNRKWKLNREQWLDRLETIADKAEKKEDFSASTKALTEVGKASGWYEPEKHELTINVIIGGNADSESDH